jgi:hypothetical protein
MGKNKNPDRYRFVVRFEVEHVLNLDNIWPDGDAPENPTVEDVYRTMRTHGKPPMGHAALDILREWNLDKGAEIVVRPVSLSQEVSTKSLSRDSLAKDMSTTIDHIVARPQMYIAEGNPEAAESLIRVLLGFWIQALGLPSLSKEVSKYLAQQYPKVPSPLRSVTSGAEAQGLNWHDEMRAFVSWYRLQASDSV